MMSSGPSVVVIASSCCGFAAEIRLDFVTLIRLSQSIALTTFQDMINCADSIDM